MTERVAWPLSDGRTLEVSALPERKSAYLLLHEDDGITALARFLDDRKAETFAAALDVATGSGGGGAA